MHIRLILLFLCFMSIHIFAAEESSPVVPEGFTQDDISGENPEFLENFFIIANFSQRLQLEDGKLSKQKGHVLVIEKDGNTFFAFYSPTDSGGFRKIGRTLATKNISFPRQDIHPEYNIPCLIVTKNDNTGSYRIYLYNGKTVIQKIDPKTETEK